MIEKPPGVSKALKLIVIVQGIIIAILLFLFIYWSVTGVGLKQLSSYADCIQAKDSVIQESYPATCVAKNGQRFIQPLSAEEQAALQP